VKHYFQHPRHSWHHNDVPGKAIGNMGTFSLLFMMVKALHSSFYKFLQPWTKYDLILLEYYCFTSIVCWVGCKNFPSKKQTNI